MSPRKPPAVPQEAPPAQPTEVPQANRPLEARTTPPAVTPPQQTPPGTTDWVVRPLISKPLGVADGAAWRLRPHPQQDRPLQQAQALQARRAALMQRLQTWSTLLAQTPLQGECQVELALASPRPGQLPFSQRCQPGAIGFERLSALRARARHPAPADGIHPACT